MKFITAKVRVHFYGQFQALPTRLWA